MIIANYILLNVFSLTLLQQFEDFYKDDKNPIAFYKKFRHKFKMSWVKYCYQRENNFMKANKLLNFFYHLGKPLGKIN